MSDYVSYKHGDWAHIKVGHCHSIDHRIMITNYHFKPSDIRSENWQLRAYLIGIAKEENITGLNSEIADHQINVEQVLGNSQVVALGKVKDNVFLSQMISCTYCIMKV